MRDARLYLEKIPTRMLDEDIIEQIQQAQEDAYNQAIQDSVKSLQNYEMIWGNGAIVPSNQFEREILKLKIK